MAVPRWLTLADEFVEAALESMRRKVEADELAPEVMIAAINAVTQRTTTHRAVIVEHDDASGDSGDRRDRQAAKLGAKGARARGKSKPARVGRQKAATPRDVDPAGQ